MLQRMEDLHPDVRRQIEAQVRAALASRSPPPQAESVENRYRRSGTLAHGIVKNYMSRHAVIFFCSSVAVSVLNSGHARVAYSDTLQYFLSETKFNTLVDMAVDEEHLPRKVIVPGVRTAMRNIRSRLSMLTHTEVAAVYDEVWARCVVCILFAVVRLSATRCVVCVFYLLLRCVYFICCCAAQRYALRCVCGFNRRAALCFICCCAAQRYALRCVCVDLIGALRCVYCFCCSAAQLCSLQEMRRDMDANGCHPAVNSVRFRDAPDPDEGGRLRPYGNPQFHRVLAHVFKSKRRVYTPADLAFVELVTTATLNRTSLAHVPDCEKLYRLMLVFAKGHVGRHIAIGGPAGKTLSFVLGSRCVCVCVCVCACVRACACVCVCVCRCA